MIGEKLNNYIQEKYDAKQVERYKEIYNKFDIDSKKPLSKENKKEWYLALYDDFKKNYLSEVENLFIENNISDDNLISVLECFFKQPNACKFYLLSDAKNNKIKNLKIKDKYNEAKNTIILPCKNRTESAFFYDASFEFTGNDRFMYHTKKNEIVEIKKVYSKLEKREVTSFITPSVKEFFQYFDNMINCQKNELGPITSPTELLISHFMCSDYLVKQLHKVERFSNAPAAYIKDGKLVFSETGYCEDLECMFIDAPKIEYMTTEKSKALLAEIIKDVSFEKDSDRTFFYAYLFGPACRFLYSSSTARTPVFVFLGNRPNVGKDTAAGISQIVYQGEFIQESPIVDEKKSDTDELRKRIFAFLLRGGRLHHSSNNRGHLSNEEYERILTAEVINDRILSQSKDATVRNEADFSLSGNLGMTMSVDMKRRSRIINLKYDAEFIEKREFTFPDLHRHIAQNRGEYLSAIYSLVKDWYDNGAVSGQSFTGFPEWAKVVGGILSYHGLGDCTVIQNVESLEDSETKSMKALFNYAVDKQNKISGNTYGDIASWVCELQEDGFFEFLETLNEHDVISMTKKANSVFSIMFKKYIDRIFNNIQLVISKKDVIKNSRTLYKFNQLLIFKTDSDPVFETP